MVDSTNGFVTRISRLARFAAVSLVLFLPTSAVLAGVDWSFSSTPDGAGIVVGQKGSLLNILGQPLQNQSGTKGVIGATLTLAEGIQNDEFKGQNYQLNMTLNDLNGGPGPHSTVLQFNGTISGSISAGVAAWDNQFTGPTTYSDVQLGDNFYTVSIGPFQGPQPGGPNGSIGLSVTVTAQDGPTEQPPTDPPTHETPEPTSLALVLAGASSLGLGAWWRRRQARSA